MPPPKDPEALAAYREKMRRIALERGYGKWMAGKSPTAETRRKLSEAQRAIAADPDERARRSQRAKDAGSGLWMRGRTLPPEHRKAIGRSAAVPYEERYGERADEERAKRRESNRARWDGVERKPQRDKHNGDWRYKEWRTAVFTRDDYTCRGCGVRGGRLHAHHVLTWAQHPEARYDVSNGRTVCEPCHRAAHRGDIEL